MVVLERILLQGPCAMRFFVADVQRPLANVRDLCVMGNVGTFRNGSE